MIRGINEQVVTMLMDILDEVVKKVPQLSLAIDCFQLCSSVLRVFNFASRVK